jgi:hypothetical protein
MMQPTQVHATTDAYLTWQDLLDDEVGDGEVGDETTADSAAESLPLSPLVATVNEFAPGQAVSLPPDVEALLAEKERLEGELQRLTGVGEPHPEDERIQRMYPVKVHTKESRIEERRLRQHDERQQMLKQRAQAARVAQLREAEAAAERRRKSIEQALAHVRAQLREAEAAAERRRKSIEQALAHVRAQLREAEVAAEWRRKAVEKAQAAQRTAQRQAEWIAERERKEREQALVQARWAQDRQKALQKGAQERQRAARWQQEKLDQQRADATTVVHDRQAEAQKAQRQQTRRQAQSAEAKPVAPPDTEVRPRSTAVTALDTLSPLAEKKSQALAWEQARERQQQQALARRRAEQALADQLDRRHKKRDRFAST